MKRKRSCAQGHRQKFAGGVPAANKCVHSVRTREVYGNAPRKILNFRPSEIVSAAVAEYKARIPRNRSPRTRGEHACKRSAVIKRDVDYCERECGVLQDRLGNTKS